MRLLCFIRLSGFFLTAFFLSCNRTVDILHTCQFYSLGTLCSVKSDVLPSDDIKKLVRDLEEKFSLNIDNSLVSMINDNAGKKSVVVDDDTLVFFKKVKFLVELTEGYFNPMIECACELYKTSDGEFAVVPDERDIERIIDSDLLDINDIVIDDQSHSVMLKKTGEKIDLGGIAKGFIIDKVYRLLLNSGAKKFIINFGGDIRVYGDKDYKIGIQDPERKRGQYCQIVELRNTSIATSGAYERNFTDSGIFYHHIFNPFTCMPCEIQNSSVSVICNDMVVADVFATALFVNPNLKDKLSGYDDSVEIIFN